ncbi:MAG: TlyA family RNA methyltransferase [Candidatus Babeliaceae bacterium]
MKNKKRLDLRLSELYPQFTRTQLQSLIMQGKVYVNDQPITKAGMLVSEDLPLELRYEEPKYVCRAGLKLERALESFHIDVTGLTVLDAGLSTGGFTDCLIQKGAHKVYGIDVGYGQVHEKIRQHERVVVMEKTNLRYLTDIGEKVDLITLDLSFISVLKVMDAVKALLKPAGKLIVLIKPQFEAERHQVGRGGIIKDPAIHEEVVQKVIKGIETAGFMYQGTMESPITGTMGNKEFLAYFLRK